MERNRRRRGGVLPLVLLVLLALVGAGAWNYRRNLEAEKQAAAARPLHGYSTGDLEALAAAYQSEIDAHSKRYEAQKSQHAEAKDRAYFDDQVREFEKVQKQSNRVREAGAEVSVRQAELNRIKEELRARSGTESEFDHQLRLLTTF